jgi:hypothetical protein
VICLVFLIIAIVAILASWVLVRRNDQRVAAAAASISEADTDRV